MRHHCRAKDTAAQINPLTADNARGREVACEHATDGDGRADEGKLDTKANDNAKDECHDEILKGAETAHTAIRGVEDQNDKDVEKSDGTTSDQWDF